MPNISKFTISNSRQPKYEVFESVSADPLSEMRNYRVSKGSSNGILPRRFVSRAVSGVQIVKRCDSTAARKKRRFVSGRSAAGTIRPLFTI